MSRAPSSTPAVHPTVLLAEDDPELRRVVTRSLKRAGFHVTAVENGSEAALLLAERAFDAVLIDVGMPKMTGLELLRATREHDLDVPILVMSGAPDADSAEDALRFGATDYIRKPFDVSDLVRLLRRAIDPRP